MSILYITYDGVLEPLGESQVLAYQEKLSKNFKIIILSYEKKVDLKNKKKVKFMKERLRKSSIVWRYHRYHKAPNLIATFYDLFTGLIHCSYLIFKYKIKIIHARSYPPAVIALILKKLFGVTFIFDMRGFWADERVDGNIWKKDSLIYHLTKSLEKSFIKNSDHIVSLTYAGVEEIKKFHYVKNLKIRTTVISTCVDLDRFYINKQKSNEANFKFGYLGNVGTWYLFDETLKAFKVALEVVPKSELTIINKGQHDFIRSKLNEHKLPLKYIELIDADHSEVPKYLNEISASIFFLKPVFSKQGSAPTKLGEFLASGIPCLTNESVGDMGRVINKGNVGVTIDNFDEMSIRYAVISLIKLANEKDIAERCAKIALENFSLNQGCESYSKIYKELLI